MLEIPEKEKIITIIKMFFPEAKIYLFGSYARQQITRTSDIDIAIDNGAPASIADLGRVQSMTAHLRMAPRVDIVDYQTASPELQESIAKEGIEWTK